MSSTTIRVDSETHARLVELSRKSGHSLIETVREASEALRRQRFADAVVEELVALRNRPGEWDAYLGEAESAAVTDGLDR
jgi:predicted transcriptional regulator